AYIGVYDFASQSILFGDPSLDIDSEPTWNPSGTHIAYIRRPNQKNVVPFTPRRSYHPWSIRMLDVEKMEAKELWKADPGAGSVLYGSFPSGEKIRFAGEDKLIFPWEKNGWVQLYALSVEDGLIIHLTRGEGIVEDYDLTDEGTAIYYTSNVGDSHRRHIFRIDLNGSNYSQITGGKGIEWNPIVTPAGLIILRSTAQRPAWPAIVKNSRIQDLAFDLIPKLDLSDLSDPELIEITATDGMEVPATLFYPSDYNASKAYPAIIFLHGGSRRQMLQGFHYRGYYSNAYALNQYFASKGYIVMALNYRSGKGLGLNFREALEYGVTGASEVRDLIGAGEYLKNRTDVDDDRIGLWGGSYGGYLTAHGLAQRSDLFAVGVDIHGVHNWNTELPNFASWYDAVKFPDIARLAYQSSPEYYVNGWKSPVLFIHGDDDRNVPFGETVYLTELLRERGVDFEQIIFPDEVHSFLLHKHWIIAQTATFEFIHNALSKK
ncbi:MAG: prolyl oligopeptidase family serine peptidase, partial [Bacteroidia bacterium]|nr:prolyl oligopeptidase family serine peptidase [Bacteroidia bacterium]